MKRTRTDYIVVHCSATKPKMDWGFKEIDAEHKKRGFKMCGYHIIIRRDGTREIGRHIDDVGAHVQGYNHNSVGVCLIGGVDDHLKPENNFTPAQMGALWQVLQRLTVEFPKAEVLGHCDLNAGKACPSFDVKQWYAEKLHHGD